MGELWISDYVTAPRGLASNTGFEEEDRARALLLAQNEINSQYYRTLKEAEKLLALLWKQEKYRRPLNEADFIKHGIDDLDMVLREAAKDGALPARE